eukprot:TRINITY_DN92305_c0_g1_i1.p1 TRINITY_DN92305_c0_g1~~TRINITY_DN92305_c0_g1_i1.p1  ORF type:complete len:387 (-),score=95.71 TRINITY_DN92305_c0_g1_i1:13-1173(-)
MAEGQQPLVQLSSAAAPAVVLAGAVAGFLRWQGRRKASVALLGTASTAALCAALIDVLAHWRRGRRKAQMAAMVSATPLPPAPLLTAVQSFNAVAMLGGDFLAPRRTLSLAQQLARCLAEGLALGEVEDRKLATTLQQKLSKSTLSEEEAEAAVGEVSQALGAPALRRRLRLLSRRQPRHEEVADARLQALAEVPFTSLLTVAWSVALEDHFPRHVGRNFGGFATLLNKPRIDKAPGASRPVLQLWPAIESSCKSAQELPTCREDCELYLDSGAFYPTFLRDVFRSKVVVLLGWPALPPSGHVGAALQQAWQDVRARDPHRREPLAYAFASEAEASPVACRQCMESYGLHVISYDARIMGQQGLAQCLRTLAVPKPRQPREDGSGG